MAAHVNRPNRPGKRPIFRPWITCPRTGRRIYPKNARVFVIWVDDDSDAK